MLFNLNKNLNQALQLKARQNNTSTSTTTPTESIISNHGTANILAEKSISLSNSISFLQKARESQNAKKNINVITEIIRQRKEAELA